MSGITQSAVFDLVKELDRSQSSTPLFSAIRIFGSQVLQRLDHLDTIILPEQFVDRSNLVIAGEDPRSRRRKRHVYASAARGSLQRLNGVRKRHAKPLSVIAPYQIQQRVDDLSREERKRQVLGPRIVKCCHRDHPSRVGFSVPEPVAEDGAPHVNFSLTEVSCQCKIYQVGDSPKLAFGKSAKQQIAERIQSYVKANFGENSAKAAKSLGISRQRLFSYTSGKTLPNAPMFDLLSRKWGLNLLGKDPGRRGSRVNRTKAPDPVSTQPSLFDIPVTLTSGGLKVVIARRGPRLVASIEIATDVEIAS